MSTVIRDGSGGGNNAKVDGNNNLHTYAINSTQELSEAFSGNAYNLNTGDISFTGATANQAVSYVKYTGDKQLIITSFIYLLGNSTGGTGDLLVDVLSDPTAGTIVSEASSGTAINRNFSSSKTLSATWYIAAAEGKTFTDGTVALSSRLASVGRHAIPVFVALSKGGALGIRYSPQTSNTSQKCQFAIACYENNLGDVL